MPKKGRRGYKGYLRNYRSIYSYSILPSMEFTSFHRLAPCSQITKKTQELGDIRRRTMFPASAGWQDHSRWEPGNRNRNWSDKHCITSSSIVFEDDVMNTANGTSTSSRSAKNHNYSLSNLNSGVNCSTPAIAPDRAGLG